MKKGFTLIEVIVTMALISIIVVLTTSIISGNYISILKTGSELDSYYAAQEKLNRAIVNDLRPDGQRERDWLLENDTTVRVVTSNIKKDGKTGYIYNPELTEQVMFYTDTSVNVTEKMNLLMITVTYTDINGTANSIFGYVME